jgi:hypothetical protein
VAALHPARTTPRGNLVNLPQTARRLKGPRSGDKSLATNKARHHLLGRTGKPVNGRLMARCLIFEDRGEPLSDIARSYNVSQATISRLGV